MHNWNELYTRYLRKQCSVEEIHLLLEHFQLMGEESELQSRILSELADERIPEKDAPVVEAAFDRIHHRLTAYIDREKAVLQQQFNPPHFRNLRYVAAASIVAILCAWIFFGRTIVNPSSEIVSAQDIKPGGNRASLVLPDGRTIDLSEDRNSIVIGNGITYTDGSDVLSASGTKSTVQSSFNEKNNLLNTPSLLTLSTPKGGTYQVTLPDGTKVWLNAATTLKYPFRFNARERKVEIEGEGYFSVAKDVDRPFIVVSAGQEIKVLGTEFNVTAYPEEHRLTTTLVEGAIQLFNRHSTEISMLKPGEQGTVRGASTEVRSVDISQYVAWKEGIFSFNETELRTVMNQLSRWYNVEVVYQGDIQSAYYYGAMSMHEQLADVLELLKESGLHFKVERVGGINRLVVLP